MKLSKAGPEKQLKRLSPHTKWKSRVREKIASRKHLPRPDLTLDLLLVFWMMRIFCLVGFHTEQFVDY
ncbi:hypothetical protein MHYP_G00310690 [Metynnis hypsauchen]